MTSEQDIKLPEIDDFDIMKPISRGAFGHVYLAKKKDKSDMLYAVKTMKKKDLVNKNMMEHVIAERDALAIAKSPYVVHLYYSFQSENQIFLVMEYLIGGDVKSLLHNLGYFDEHMSKIYIAQVVLALEYLHGHGIVHRDLKPDNMLVTNDGHIKLTDFGLSSLDLERNKKPTIMDVMNTPSCKWPQSSSSYWRTPGQIASLTTDFTFSVPKSIKPKARSLSRILSEERIEKIESYNFSSPVNKSCSRIALRRSNPQRRDSFPETPDRHNRSFVATPLNAGATHEKSGKRGRKRDMERWRSNWRDLDIGSPEGDSDSEDNENHLSPKRRKTSHTGLTCVLDNIGIETTVNDTSSGERSYLSDNSPESQDMSLTENNHVEIDPKPSTCDTDELKKNLKDHYDNSITSDVFESCTDTFSTTPATQPAPNDTNTSLNEVDQPCGNISTIDQCVPVQNQQGSPENLHSPPNPFITPAKCNISSRRGSFEGVSNKENITSQEDKKVFQTPVGNAPKHYRTASVTRIRFQSPMEMANTNSRGAKTTPRLLHHQPITPLRTPKSCKRGRPEKTVQRILGTPDYLAPEILLEQHHGVGVDWWALGVCLYEFMIGIPPFNDDTPELVFQHILDVEYVLPEGEEALSNDAECAINSLLIKDVTKRPTAGDIKKFSFFSSLDWANLYNYPAPFVPNPDDETDTTYFEARNNVQHLQLSSFHN